MTLAIMQPYFLPYIGYWQLINAVDAFVVYDNIKYTKKGWINRNRFLQNGKDALFSLPLKKDSDFLDVVGRELAADFSPDKLLKQLCRAYASAPYFKDVIPLLEHILRFENRNLFHYIHHSIVCLCHHFGLKTKLIVSSEIPIDHSLKAQDKVLALCEALGADTYINPIGGATLYTRQIFAEKGITLQFIESKLMPYAQYGGDFAHSLSITDVLMFNDLEAITRMLDTGYSLT